MQTSSNAYVQLYKVFGKLAVLSVTWLEKKVGWLEFLYFYAPNFEKVGGILVSACPCVRACMCPSVRKKIQARVLKFRIWIPRKK